MNFRYLLLSFGFLAISLLCSCISKTDYALIYAAMKGDTNHVRFLLEEGADPNIAHFYDGKNALIHAVEREHVETAKELIKAKTIIDHKDSLGHTALYYAVEKGNKELVILLLEAKANPRVAANDGKTPLQLSKELDKPEITELLEAAKSADAGQSQKP